MLRDVLTYPVRGPDAEHRYVRGLLLAFAVAAVVRVPGGFGLAAVLPAVLLLGILAGVYAHSLSGGATPRRVDALSTVVRRGATVGVVCLGYLAPALAAVVVTLEGARSTSASPEALGFPQATGVLLGSTAVLGIVLGSVFLLPVAVARVLRTGSLMTGIPTRSLIERAIDGAYFTAFGVGAGLLLVAVGLAGALASVNRVGGAVGVVVTFHVLVGVTYLVGRGFGAAGTVADLL